MKKDSKYLSVDKTSKIVCELGKTKTISWLVGCRGVLINPFPGFNGACRHSSSIAGRELRGRWGRDKVA